MIKKAFVVIGALLSVFLIFWFSRDYIYGFLKPLPDFDIYANPSLIVLRGSEGSSNSTTITVKSMSGFNGNVSFEVSKDGIIGDIRVDLNVQNLYLQADEKDECILTLYVYSLIPPGKYYVYVTGISGELKHSISISVTVPV